MELKKKTIILYLIGTFILSYSLWGIMILFNKNGLFAYGTGPGMVMFLIGGLSPTIISFIVLLTQHEVSGLKQILKAAFTIKQKPVIYVMIIIFTAIPYLVNLIFGKITIAGPAVYVLFAIPAMMVGGGFEELGWRYILQPFLDKKLSLPISTAIVGIIWSLWHLPLFYISGTSQNLYMSFGTFTIEIMGLAFVLGLLSNLGNGVFPCILFHSLNNSMNATFGIEENRNTAIISMILIIILSLIWKWKIDSCSSSDVL